jgi:hypothetical protein
MRPAFRRLAPFAPAVVFVAIGAACGGDDDVVTSSSPSAGPGADQVNALFTPNAGGKYGSVSLSQNAHDGLSAVAANAAFQDTTLAPSSCTVTPLGAGCFFADCPAPGLATPQPSAPASTIGQAGTLTIRGGEIPGALTLTVDEDGPDEDGTYGIATPPGTPYFHGGDALTFSATGDPASVGAFSATVIAPADLAVSAPSFAHFPATLSRASDLRVAWSPGTPGTYVHVFVDTASTPALEDRSVSCTYEATAGSGVVPSAGGLAQLFATDGTKVIGFVSITPLSVAIVSASDADGGVPWNVSLQVTGTAVGSAFTSN